MSKKKYNKKKSSSKLVIILSVVGAVAVIAFAATGIVSCSRSEKEHGVGRLDVRARPELPTIVSDNYKTELGTDAGGAAREINTSAEFGFYLGEEFYSKMRTLRGHNNLSGAPYKEQIQFHAKSEAAGAAIDAKVQSGFKFYFFDESDYQDAGIETPFTWDASKGWFTFEISRYRGYYLFKANDLNGYDAAYLNYPFISTASTLWSSTADVTYYSGYRLTAGVTRDIYINVDDRFTLDQIKFKIKASDFYGADVPFTMTSATYQLGVIGTFPAVLKASDTYSNSVEAYLNIKVSDYAKPSIVKIDNVAYSYTKKVTSAEVLSHFRITDNVAVAYAQLRDGRSILFDTSGSVDSFTLSAGNYDLTLTVVDTSGNESALNFEYISIDDVAPAIESPFETDVHEIAVENVSPAFVRNIIERYTAVDAVDGACKITFEGSIGIAADDYFYTIKTKDKSGNETSKVVTFRVSNKNKPFFILDEDLYLTSIDNPLSSDAILKVIVEKEGLETWQVAGFKVDAKKYQNATKEGVYPVNYALDLTDGEQRINTISFKVAGSKKTGWQKFCDAIATPFREIAKFFRWIWRGCK